MQTEIVQLEKSVKAECIFYIDVIRHCLNPYLDLVSFSPSVFMLLCVFCRFSGFNLSPVVLQKELNGLLKQNREKFQQNNSAKALAKINIYNIE